MLDAIAPVPSHTQLVYERLRDALRDARLEGGRLLNEADLARQLGVSKTPVREALLRLASEGFVQTLPRRGSQVVHLSLRDIEEIFEVREMLEAEVIRLALPRLDDAVLAELDAIVQRGSEAIARAEYAPFTAADIQLHDRLAQAAGNSRLLQMLDGIRGWVQRVRMACHEYRLDPSRPARAQAEHAQLVEALRARDPGAELIVREHVASLKRDLLRHLEAQGRDHI